MTPAALAATRISATDDKQANLRLSQGMRSSRVTFSCAECLCSPVSGRKEEIEGRHSRAYEADERELVTASCATGIRVRPGSLCRSFDVVAGGVTPTQVVRDRPDEQRENRD